MTEKFIVTMINGEKFNIQYSGTESFDDLIKFADGNAIVHAENGYRLVLKNILYYVKKESN